MKKIIIMLLLSGNAAAFGDHTIETMRFMGDWTQIINPVAAGILASQERGALHFGIHMAQTQLVIEGGKWAGRKWKFEGSKRPDSNSHCGMPSGHTAAAWVGAAYTREHSVKYQHLVIPMYGVAVFTGASRILSKRHSLQQVIVGAVLAEAIVFANSEMKWCQVYGGYDLGVTTLGINIKL